MSEKLSDIVKVTFPLLIGELRFDFRFRLLQSLYPFGFIYTWDYDIELSAE